MGGDLELPSLSLLLDLDGVGAIVLGFSLVGGGW